MPSRTSPRPTVPSPVSAELAPEWAVTLNGHVHGPAVGSREDGLAALAALEADVARLAAGPSPLPDVPLALVVRFASPWVPVDLDLECGSVVADPASGARVHVSGVPLQRVFRQNLVFSGRTAPTAGDVVNPHQARAVGETWSRDGVQLAGPEARYVTSWERVEV